MWFIKNSYCLCGSITVISSFILQEFILHNEGDANKETVTFLYKTKPGMCPNSFGFNVARLAGMSPQFIQDARNFANYYECLEKNRNMFKRMMTSDDPSEIRAMLPIDFNT